MTQPEAINDLNVKEVNNFPNITRDGELRFQVYALVDPTTGPFHHPSLGALPHSPFYIGKGNDGRKRGHVYESSTDSNLPKDNKLRILLQSFTIDEIFLPLRVNQSHSTAIKIEKQLIEALGRRHLGGLLCNITSGGEGRAEPHTEEWKATHSMRMTGSQNPSAKRVGYLCHLEKGNHQFGVGEFNALCVQLGLAETIRKSTAPQKLLSGSIHSYKGFILSDRPLSVTEVGERLAAIKALRADKFKATMVKRRNDKNDDK